MSAASRHRHSPHPPIRVINAISTALAVLLAVGLPACGASSGPERAGEAASMDVASPVSQSAAAPPLPPETRGANAPADRSDEANSLGMIGAQAAPSMVIRSGRASIEVDTLPRAIASIQRITASLGGYVGNSAIALGEDQVRRATIELKIPVSRYDDAIAGLSPLGEVESVNSSAEDVGEEFTDLTARITNAHRLESRLIALLAERTGKLQDALMVERELARVREEIERYQGRIRFLGARVAMSTLTVSLHEPIPLVSQNPSESVLVAAAKDAWRNFMTLLALAISSLGVLLPVGAVGVLAYALYRRRVAGQPTRTVAAPITGR